ncbi:MAG: SUMF1/EgtB/PvdO family nonheme iron enzyme [Planctomycetales bacterium]|nr:SUMF1/EgtB/PvdO family nonheme iron enzyme [Planctomycetales bacterium]
MRIFNGVRFRAWFLSLLVCGLWQSYATAGIITFGSGGNQFTMNFVDIGNAGNAADTTGDPNRAGAVAYAYGLGKYEVSDDMITKFNASQSLQITTDNRGADKPATSVNWNEAARFTNWLNTSTGGSAAYNFTSNGVNANIALWTVADTLDYDINNHYRSLRATYVLPSMDEWYKAAYYNPTTSTYFDFPNGLDTAPTAVASGTADGTAVYDGQTGPADVTQAGGLSPYGIMGLGGNLYEWEETAYDMNNSSGSSVRGVRGGSWDFDSGDLSSLIRYSVDPVAEIINGSFRVASLSSFASVPEPGTFGVLSLVGLALVAYRKRMKK